MSNETEFTVLVNDEEQYSLWPGYLKVPDGWTLTGAQGSREECLEYVNQTWTDMRPKSLRLQMEGSAS
jgi:MbtH protein